MGRTPDDFESRGLLSDSKPLTKQTETEKRKLLCHRQNDDRIEKSLHGQGENISPVIQ